MDKVLVEVPTYTTNARRQLVQTGTRRFIAPRKVAEKQLSLPERPGPDEMEDGVEYRIQSWDGAEIVGPADDIEQVKGEPEPENESPKRGRPRKQPIDA